MALKSEILEILEQSRDKDISGQELAEKLSVSRAAVWKAVKSLREDGHAILAATNRGYRLAENSDQLSREGIHLYLKPQSESCNILCYKTIGSTNTEAKRLALNGADAGTIVIAQEQTAGKGRRGKSFYSPEGTGIYMSIILRPQIPAQDAVLITIAAAVAVCRAIESLTELKPQIKWVNDIFLDGKKICGILTEAVSDFESGIVDTVVVGIGINVTTQKFPDELSGIAGSLCAQVLNRNMLAANIINELLCLTQDLPKSAFVEEYKTRSFILGKRISFIQDGAQQTGAVINIDNRGRLEIKKENGSFTVLQSGEATILK